VGGVGRWADRAREVTSKRRVFCRGFVTDKEDLNVVTTLEQGGLRAEGKESLDEWNFGSLTIVMAEIVK
jgi:hypothetical protein